MSKKTNIERREAWPARPIPHTAHLYRAEVRRVVEDLPGFVVEVELRPRYLEFLELDGMIITGCFAFSTEECGHFVETVTGSMDVESVDFDNVEGVHEVRAINGVPVAGQAVQVTVRQEDHGFWRDAEGRHAYVIPELGAVVPLTDEAY